MWGDFFKRSRPNESTRVLVARRIYIIISSFLLVAVFVILCKEMHDEVPGVETIFKPVDNIPIPDIGFFSPQNFTITCGIINPDGEIILNETECSKRNILQPTPSSPYNGSFLPKEILNFNKTEGIHSITFFLNTTGSIYDNSPIMMRAYDPEYSYIRGNLDYTTNGSRTYQFAKEILTKNHYFLTKPNPNSTFAYWWTFSRHIRYTIVENALTYIGFPMNYPQPYLESSIQSFSVTDDSPNIIQVTVRAQDYLSDFYAIIEEKEQKNKTIASILGNLGGILSGITFFYVLLFGAELISPWGYAQTLLRDRPKLDKYPKKGKDDDSGETEQKNLEDVKDTTQENPKEDFEKRIQILEDYKNFCENYVIDTSSESTTTKPWYKCYF